MSTTAARNNEVLRKQSRFIDKEGNINCPQYVTANNGTDLLANFKVLLTPKGGLHAFAVNFVEGGLSYWFYQTKGAWACKPTVYRAETAQPSNDNFLMFLSIAKALMLDPNAGPAPVYNPEVPF